MKVLGLFQYKSLNSFINYVMMDAKPDQNTEYDLEESSSLSALRGKLDDDPEYNKQYKKARWGVILFSIFFIIFQLFVSNKINIGIAAIIQYILSMSYIAIKYSSSKGIENPFLTGLTVSCIIFLIKLAIVQSVLYFIL
ncbi:MAG: hypothetical protein IPK96_12585 [Flammeovirgaceae bacterium]|nr:hypothetical protein [Flammeovirgaceae bacterium]